LFRNENIIQPLDDIENKDDTTYNTNCISTFDVPISLNNVISTKLISLDFLDFAVFTFKESDKTNCFYLIEENTNLEYLISIPEGYYNTGGGVSGSSIGGLSTIIQFTINYTFGNNKLNSSGTGPEYSNFKVSFCVPNSRMTISNTVNNFTMIFLNEHTNQNLYKNIGWKLGFRKIKYTNAKSYTSEGLFSDQKQDSLFFSLNDFSTYNVSEYYVLFKNTYVKDNILGKFNYNNTNSLSSTSNYYITRKYSGPINIKKIQVQLLDKYGDLVELNNMNYSFTLEFEMSS
jgi:hypothetical protein